MYYATIMLIFFLTDFMLSNIIFLPLITFFIFFLITTFYLYFSLKNIFKIFFLTEILLLITVIFLLQIIAFNPETASLNYFYSQLILAAAAAEGALFLGLFSHLYDQQFSNWVSQTTTFSNNTKKKFFNLYI